MSVTNLTIQYLTQTAEMDIENVLEVAFSNAICIPRRGLAQMIDVMDIRWGLLLKGELTEADDLALRAKLVHQLEVTKRFSEAWLHSNPNPDELLAVWEEQVEAEERWEVFISTFYQFGNLKASLEYGFNGFQFQKLSFHKEEAKKLWYSVLKNQQQELVDGQNLTEIRMEEEQLRVEGNLLYTGKQVAQLYPTYARLLDNLMDGEPKTVPFLLKEIFGIRSQSSVQKEKLSRRISELNLELKKYWGPPPEKRWIVQIMVNAQRCYKLLKPSTLA